MSRVKHHPHTMRSRKHKVEYCVSYWLHNNKFDALFTDQVAAENWYHQLRLNGFLREKGANRVVLYRVTHREIMSETYN